MLKKFALPVTAMVVFLGSFVPSANAWLIADLPVITFGGASHDYAYKMAFDSNNNIYATGSFEGTVDFDPSSTGTATLTSAGSTDAFITKFDSNGDFLWAKKFGGNLGDGGRSVAADTNGNVYVAGVFQGSSNFHSGSSEDSFTAFSSNDVFLTKLNSEGAHQWTKRYGGNGNDAPVDLAIDSSNGLVLVVNYNGTADFDSSSSSLNVSSSNGSSDIAIAKISSDGITLWAKSIGGTGTDAVSRVRLTQSNEIVIVGYFQLTADFNPSSDAYTVTSNGNPDIFLLKLGADGSFAWVKTYGSTAADYASGLSIDSTGNIIFSGLFQGTVDFDASSSTFSLTSSGSYDPFVEKVDASGNLMWVKSFGGAGEDWSSGVALDSTGNVYVSGFFKSAADFNPGADYDTLTAQSVYFDGFLTKLNTDGNYSWTRTLSGSFEDRIQDVRVNSVDGIYVLAYINGTIDLNMSTGTRSVNTSATDIYIGRLRSNGDTSFTLDEDIPEVSIVSSNSSENSIRLAREERQRQVEAAVGELKLTLASGKPLTPDQFTKADIRGVTAKNVSSINEEIQKLGPEVSQSIVEIARIVFKYEVAGRIEASSTVYYPELVSAGLAPINSPYKTATLRELKKYPIDKVDSLTEISAAIIEIQQKYEARTNRLKEIINRINNGRR